MARGRGSEGKLTNRVCSLYPSHYLRKRVSSITTADAHTSAASNFDSFSLFCLKRKSRLCTWAITFQTQITAPCCPLFFLTFPVFHGIINQVPPLYSVCMAVKMLHQFTITVLQISADNPLQCLSYFPLPSITTNIKYFS